MSVKTEQLNALANGNADKYTMRDAAQEIIALEKRLDAQREYAGHVTKAAQDVLDAYDNRFDSEVENQLRVALDALRACLQMGRSANSCGCYCDDALGESCPKCHPLGGECPHPASHIQNAGKGVMGDRQLCGICKADRWRQFGADCWTDWSPAPNENPACKEPWVSVDDRLPEDDYPVLVVNGNGYMTVVTTIYKSDGGVWYGEDATPEETRDAISGITHWALTPAYPSKENAVCKDFAPGADPSRCLYCGVNVESHVTCKEEGK